MEQVQEPNLEQIYIVGSLRNILTCGDRKILEPVDEVDDIHAISYDQKRKAIVKRTTKKRRITLNHSILITTEEKLIKTEHARTSKLIGARMTMTDATLDREKRDEEELVVCSEGIGTSTPFGEILPGHHTSCSVPEERISGGLQ
jgi:hypothetical protein